MNLPEPPFENTLKMLEEFERVQYTCKNVQSFRKRSCEMKFVINDPVRGKIFYAPTPKQEKLLESFKVNNRFMYIKLRQIGFSTTALYYVCNYILENRNAMVAWIGAYDTERWRNIAKNNLPEELVNHIVFSSDTSKLRGFSYDIIVLDEALWIREKDISLSDVFRSHPQKIIAGTSLDLSEKINQAIRVMAARFLENRVQLNNFVIACSDFNSSMESDSVATMATYAKKVEK